MNEDGKMKVIDNRMFDENGELKEEFRHLESLQSNQESVDPESVDPQSVAQDSGSDAASRFASTAGQFEPTIIQPPEASPTGVTPRAAPAEAVREAAEPHPDAPAEASPLPVSEETVQFLDLVALIVEPVSVFLGEAPLPDGRVAQDLERARFYIDLLDVLKAKTAGNLVEQETAVLDDLIYRLRMLYVEKSRG